MKFSRSIARAHTGRVALAALVIALAIVVAVSTFASSGAQPYIIPALSDSQIKTLKVSPSEEAALQGETDISEQQAESVPETGSEANGTLQDTGK
jgi:hypothetical protein